MKKKHITNSCTRTIQSGTCFAKKAAKTCHFKLPVSKALALINESKMLIKSALSSLSKKEIARPIFILGCGRSGTTIFGMTLSKHNSITYLNERRDLWFEAYPETDIWTHQATARNGKMHLTSENIDSVKK